MKRDRQQETESVPSPRMNAGTAAETVRLEERHRGAIEAFFREVWNAPPPPLDPAAPGFGLLIEGRLAGYIGTLPVRFWDGVQEHSGHWMKGLMVLPQYRNGGIGFLVLRH